MLLFSRSDQIGKGNSYFSYQINVKMEHILVRRYLFQTDREWSYGKKITFIWAAVQFVFVEHLILESKHKNNILVMVRFTQDIIIVWKKTKKEPNDWKDFKRCHNQAQNLIFLRGPKRRGSVFGFRNFHRQRWAKFYVQAIHQVNFVIITLTATFSSPKGSPEMNDSWVIEQRLESLLQRDRSC